MRFQMSLWNVYVFMLPRIISKLNYSYFLALETEHYGVIVGHYDHFIGEPQLFNKDPQIIIGNPQLFI